MKNLISNRLLWSMLAFLQIALQTSCVPSLGGGGSSSTSLSSTDSCSQADIVNPELPMPTAMSKLFIEGSDEILPGTQFVAVVDHACKAKTARAFSKSFANPSIATVKKGTSRRAYRWKAPSGTSRQSLAQQVNADPCLLSLEVDHGMVPFRTVTNDPQFANQTHLEAIHAPEAYDIFYDGSTGISSNVVLAVIDSGMQMSHPDLTNRRWVNTGETAGNSIDDDSNGYVDDVYGYNFASAIGDPNAQGTASHGTHVAGLAAAQGNNSIGVTGVAGRQVQLMTLNVFGNDESSASNADIINAIYYAADQGAEVINMSLGGAGPSPATKTALDYAVAHGAFVVAAAGNSAVELNTSTVPAGYGALISGMVAVGSQEVTTLALSSFSNFSSSYVEIAAPGSDADAGGLLSTIPGSTYGFKQGTSMASPVVAGAAAIALSLVKSRGHSMTPGELESLIVSNATTQPLLTGGVKACAALNLKNIADAIEAKY